MGGLGGFGGPEIDLIWKKKKEGHHKKNIFSLEVASQKPPKPPVFFTAKYIRLEE